MPGDRVQPGTVLAVLSNPAVISELAQAKANLASAEAERASLHAQSVVQDVAVHAGQTLALGGGIARVAGIKSQA